MNWVLTTQLIERAEEVYVTSVRVSLSCVALPNETQQQLAAFAPQVQPLPLAVLSGPVCWRHLLASCTPPLLFRLISARACACQGQQLDGEPSLGFLEEERVGSVSTHTHVHVCASEGRLSRNVKVGRQPQSHLLPSSDVRHKEFVALSRQLTEGRQQRVEQDLVVDHLWWFNGHDQLVSR